MNIERYLKKTGQKDTAVYWGEPTKTASGGMTYLYPVEIGCIWKSTVENIITTDGKEIVSMAQVWVTEEVVDHAMIFHGTLDDLTDAEIADPRLKSNAIEIKQVLKTPSLSIKGTFNRKAYL
jgi:hypothetical protein